MERLADLYAKTQNDVGAVGWWFDPQRSALQQSRDLESMGETIMNQLMVAAGGDPTVALKGLPVFWSRLVTAGKDGEYGADLQKDLLFGTSAGNEYKRFDAMYESIERGAMKHLGVEMPTADSGITEIEAGEPQRLSQALADWGLVDYAKTMPTNPLSPLIMGGLLLDSPPIRDIKRSLNNIGRSPGNQD